MTISVFYLANEKLPSSFFIYLETYNRLIMKKIITFFFISSFSFTSFAQNSLPDTTAILQKMVLANNYFMTEWPDPSTNIVTNKSRPSNLWTRAVYYEGLMQLYDLTKDSRLYNYAVDWGKSHNWQPTYTGTTATRIADNQCCGQTYVELYQIDPQDERIATIKKSLDLMVGTAKSDDWWWIDAIQMAMPLFAKFGKLTSDTAYYKKMYDLYCFPRYKSKGAGLYNSSYSLWYRDSTFLPPNKTANNLPIYWSRGNGWVFCALARVLETIPQNETHRNEYLDMFRSMAAKLIKIQRSDGFWNCNLGDPEDYGGKETSGTALFVYGIAWGINHGILDSAQYMPSVIKGWNGMVNDALHPTGALGYVQSSGSKPADGQPLSYDKMPDFDDFGLGAFLLAGKEVYKIAALSSSTVEVVPEKSDSNMTLSLSPNPFRDKLRIECSAQNVPCTLSVFDSLGNQITSWQLSENMSYTEWIPKTNISGCLIIQIANPHYSICKKVIRSM